MWINEGEWALSATDLSNFLGCRHRTALDMSRAHGKRTFSRYVDPVLELLIARGMEHEKNYVQSLRTAGRNILDLSDIDDRDARVRKTTEAMRAGADVIVQGALADGPWYGKPDLLQRVEKKSDLGDWSYEIADTKLARETRAGTILQLGLYSEMLGLVQGTRPEFFYVITPDPKTPKHTYRTDDYAAYFRLMRSELRRTVALDDDVVAADNYPEPVDHCDICPWCSGCIKLWHKDDHLSLVAGISRLQRRELAARGITRLADLAKMALPLTFKPDRGNKETYERIREQARMQFESREKPPPPVHKLREFAEGMGLNRLPEPCPGDLFLDLEGDPFAAEGGREYLFGIISIEGDGKTVYRSYWAFNEHDERLAFESVMDLITRTIEQHPAMHVYHYAPYEPSAFKRLMGRYATRESDLDAFLRSGRFVDLYGVVRQSLIAGIERYSIKNLEVFYDFDRDVDLRIAGRNRQVMEQALEFGTPDRVPEEVRDSVEGYNRDDCISTLRLRDWLEKLRSEAVAAGAPIVRPIPEDAAPTEALDEKAQRVDALRARLLAGIPDATEDRTEDQKARWLLAYMLDWHRRESKAVWWDYYRLCELPGEDLFDERDAVAGLAFVKRVGVKLNKKGKPTGKVVDRYSYPLQEMEINPGDQLRLQDEARFGEVTDVDRAQRTIDIEKGKAFIDHHPSAAFAFTYFDPTPMPESLFRLGECIAAEGRIGDGKAASWSAARDLLMKRPPRMRTGVFSIDPARNGVEEAVRIGLGLDETVLAIQGPPGTGKTHTAAHMICALVKKGKRVGVTAMSHKVIRNLLNAVDKAARELGMSVSLAHKTKDEDPDESSAVRLIAENDEALDALQSGEANVLGGTGWMWAREDFARAADILFVDEAGQLSLAYVLAASSGAKNVVLLGDPQQLEQPLKGSHPEGVNVSALQHILGADQTIRPERGIFLPNTWRLHPSICAFTSEVFYESRLESKPGLERQCLSGLADLNGSGLWMIPVDHEGNCNHSIEEADVIARLVERLLSSKSRWTDGDGEQRQMTAMDILVVAPYNAQVGRIAERLGASGIRIGTVDRFQGRQAPVVIFSTATSRPEDAPRGMEFLYSPNRLNVATSRAKCAAILVSSPHLFEPDCRTPRQMKLANAFCRYREMARPLTDQ